jgi:hypothetical protein
VTLPSLLHSFVNPKADGADATITRPSDWNAEHVQKGLVLGQCRLVFASPNLRLDRYNGNALFIQDQFREIPASGPTLAATGLTAGTLYYIYAYWTGTAIALEASTTAYAVATAYGNYVKSGDNTRTLVGMARPITGPAWVNTTQQRFVRSWFNRVPLDAVYSLAADRTTAAGPFVETNTADRVEFLLWADETISIFMSCWFHNSAAMTGYIAVALDGVFVSGVAPFTSSGAADIGGVVVSTGTSPAEGYHYTTFFFGSGNATNVTLYAGGYTVMRVAIA